MTTISPPSQLEAALGYARRGWPVFPCDRRNKQPLLPRDRDADGKPIKGTGGLAKASCDEILIRQWWSKWPDAMIGVAVGRAGMLVIDFDPRFDTETIEDVDEATGEVMERTETREWTLPELKAAVEEQIGCSLPVSLAVRTPSGGVHVYYRMPDGEPIGNKGSLPRHVDVRGLGGYTIVPPSICLGDAKNAAGDYHWLRGDADAPIAEMPEPLVAVLRAPTPRVDRSEPPPRRAAEMDRFPVDVDAQHRRYALRALDEEMAELAATPEGGGRWGGRNNGIYHAALKMGGLVAAGAISESVVRAGLESVVREMPNNHDLPGALQTLENGLEDGRAKPRDLSAVGANRARRRDSAGSAFYPSPPLDAYADEASTAPAPPAGDGDVAFQNGTGSPASIGGGAGAVSVQPDAALDRLCGELALTDLGNAERFKARHGWRFRFCNELGWFMWDLRRWQLLSEEKDKVPWQVSLAVFETVRAIANEATAIEATGMREDDPDDPTRLNRVVGWRGGGDAKEPIFLDEALRAHAKKSEAAGRLGCIANLAKAFGAIAISADAMDSDRMAINVLNGTLRLTRTGKRWVERDGVLAEVETGNRWGVVLHPHRPEDLNSKIADVVFAPKAVSLAYDGFLATVQPEEPMRRFLHQWGGLSLTGDIGEQKLVFHHGGGRNGKSTLNDLWATIAGDYGASIAIETFLDQGRGRKGGEATPDLARLPGVRFLRTSEPEKGAKLAEALIKLVTGGEPIDARHLNKGFFTFLPSFKLSVQGNHKPKITGHDDGIWRRMMLVPWAVQIAADQVDTKLPEKLRSEASGVLNRLLAGLLDWRENGLLAPDAVIAATAKYREQSDQLGRFLAECVRMDDTARSKSSQLFALFTAWAKANGAAEWQQVGFTKAMEDRGFESKRSNGIQWLGIEMIKQPEDFADQKGGDDDADRWREYRDDGPP